MQLLFKVRVDEDIYSAVLNNGLFATEYNINCWKADGSAPPSLDPIRPYWEILDSPWNDALATLFVDEFSNTYPQYPKEDIKKHFLDRLHNLKKYIIRSGRPSLEDQRKRLHTQARRRTRRKTVSKDQPSYAPMLSIITDSTLTSVFK